MRKKSPYTLWVLCEPDGRDALFVAERPDGPREAPKLVSGPDTVGSYLAERGSPTQVLGNSWSAIRFAREAERELYQVPAEVMKPGALATSLLSILMSVYRDLSHERPAEPE